MKKDKKLLDVLSGISRKLAGQIHIRALRDGFMSSMPFLVLAGLMMLINWVALEPEFFGNYIPVEHMATVKLVGRKVLNGTMNIYALICSCLIAYNLADKKKFAAPILASVVSMATLFVLLPYFTPISVEGVADPVMLSGYAPLSLLGTEGVFLGIVVALLGTEIFLAVSKNEKLKIKLGPQVPPAVAASFNSMAAIMINLLFFGFLSLLSNVLFHCELYEIINKVLQAPLVGISTSLGGFLILSFFGNLLFAFGIHPGGIVNPILEPALMVAMSQNSAALAAGTAIPHIIVMPFEKIYGSLGGTGGTIALLVAVYIWSKRKEHREMAKLSLPTGLFNINEPVIFGFPILMNPILMIPFVIAPLITWTIAYLVTAAGLVSRLVVYVPWSTPPIINAFLASGGDVRNVILQIACIALQVIIYGVFLKIYEKTLNDQVEAVEASKVQ
ncbi:MAG: PTS transporter subunit EIIC [Erysipelotrichaceae bacterium]|jgi:PTS system cellobiose-specific IIC component|nr:PTS transporter subunit EIIC [Erysipelotrichaceae bacterium]